MFTTGKIIFASLFALIFIFAMAWSYKKDTKINSIHFSGSSKILIYIVVVLGSLFLFVKLRHLL